MKKYNRPCGRRRATSPPPTRLLVHNSLTPFTTVSWYDTNSRTILLGSAPLRGCFPQCGRPEEEEEEEVEEATPRFQDGKQVSEPTNKDTTYMTVYFMRNSSYDRAAGHMTGQQVM